jgi:hypothetical protein
MGCSDALLLPPEGVGTYEITSGTGMELTSSLRMIQ